MTFGSWKRLHEFWSTTSRSLALRPHQMTKFDVVAEYEKIVGRIPTFRGPKQYRMSYESAKADFLRGIEAAIRKDEQKKDQKLLERCLILLVSLVLTEPRTTPNQQTEITKLLKALKTRIEKT